MINKKHLKIIAFILILVISIGFAYLTSNLFINGLIGYRGNSWNIYFDNIQMINNDVDADKPIINNSKDAISFSLSFSEPGEIYKFSADIINSGTLDAMLNEIIKNGIDSSNQDYISYTIKYYDDSDLRINDAIKAGAKTRIIIEVIYKYETSVVAPAGEQEFSFILKYIHANDDANYLSPMYESKSNNVFTLNNVKSNSMSNFRIYGNTTQTQYEGYQLIKKDGLSTPLDDSDFWHNKGGSHGTISPLEDGWLRVVGDNTEGTVTTYLNFFLKKDAVSLEPDTYYTALIEFKNHSGEGNIVLTQTTLWDVEPFDSGTDDGGIRRDQLANNSSGSKKILLHTKNDLTGTLGLRGWVGLMAGESISIDIRITLVKGDYKTDDIPLVWEPYVGEEPSPNPDFPQDVKNVTGDSSLMIKGKNLINYRDIQHYALNYGVSIDENDNIYSINPSIDMRTWSYLESSWFVDLTPGTYTLSLRFSTPATTGDRQATIYDENNNRILSIKIDDNEFVKYTFTLSKAISVGILVKGYDGVYKVQLEKGDTATDWEPYKEHLYAIDFGSLELNKIDDKQDYIHYIYGSWFIHKELGKNIIDGVNNKFILKTGNSGNVYIAELPNLEKMKSNEEAVKLYNNRFTSVSYSNLNNYSKAITQSVYEVDRVRVKLSNDTTNNNVEAANTWLLSNPIIFYYKYANFYEEKINDINLISQLELIRNTNLFEGVNNIYYNSNISTDISFDYIEE